MDRHERFTRVNGLIRLRDELEAAGWSRRGIATAVRAGELVRLCRGAYMRGSDWEPLFAEDRLLSRVIATAPLQGPGRFVCSESAAALHGLPLYRSRVERVQLLVPDATTVHGSASVHRRIAPLPHNDAVDVEGILCTSLRRTVLDLARFSARMSALVCADAAVAAVVRGLPRSQRAAAADEWIAGLLAELRRGERGVRRAAELLARVDHRSESPLESVARALFEELGFSVDTQIAVRAPNGRKYYVDLELRGVGVFCEVDGAAKYRDGEMLRGRSAEDVFLEEKHRENWIEGVTQKRVIRLNAADLRSMRTLAEKLRAFGISIPRPPR
ncbi:type IV toxin-antitoxin system AbiEi family antitoxin domain-containing protein [Leucobacter ruminantium]|uniref:Type IV toxin-antitoxin system AbiEi family antitoxin domain-containing protein n=1 Tax=Leucobacter ruminantium TaxID=1289170 RepID=A0A939LVL1_9MICO|nr:type IV toxin-antitoxin system AbiEi family antitoxin domain-containing protein [Leucobacter ruminantium]MBO1803988.1 type IV toxin-antitoxin system AbiEi family antitoxin domain-containing protein [Leucobacter ruminantium]